MRCPNCDRLSAFTSTGKCPSCGYILVESYNPVPSQSKPKTATNIKTNERKSLLAHREFISDSEKTLPFRKGVDWLIPVTFLGIPFFILGVVGIGISVGPLLFSSHTVDPIHLIVTLLFLAVGATITWLPRLLVLKLFLPGNWFAIFNRANARNDKSTSHWAAMHLSKMPANSASQYFIRSVANVFLGDPVHLRNAIHDLDNVMRINPQMNFLFEKAEFLEQLGEIPKSIEILDQFLQGDSENIEVLKKKVLLLEKSRQYDKAIQEWERLKVLLSHHPELQNIYSDAEEHIKKLLQWTGSEVIDVEKLLKNKGDIYKISVSQYDILASDEQAVTKIRAVFPPTAKN